ARRRGPPSAAAREGSITIRRKRAAGGATVPNCGSCLEPKWAKRPLLLIPRSLARRPIVSPSNPSTDARSTARSRIAARVRAPLDSFVPVVSVAPATPTGYKKARTFVLRRRERDGGIRG